MTTGIYVSVKPTYSKPKGLLKSCDIILSIEDGQESLSQRMLLERHDGQIRSISTW